MEPCDLPATEARALIGRRALSPVELVESCIARILAVDPAVNAMPARDFTTARAAARRAEAAVMAGEPLPPLHGLPLGVKDTHAAAGMPFTQGSPIFRDRVPAEDERLVAGLRHAGAIVLGKTNTPEFAAGANTRNAVYGATGNPFDPARSAAGSSGGSAVALACGMVPLATGSDTGGSLRNPASFCGIVGFRPTPGLVASPGRAHGWSVLPVDGPMARNVPDLCLLLGAMVSGDARDPLAQPVRAADYAVPAAIDLSSLRVALTPDFGFTVTERVVADAFKAKTALVRHVFARADDAAPDCTGADETFGILRAVNFLTAHLERVQTRPQDVGPNVRANVAEGLTYSAADVARALAMQTAMYRRWQSFFKDYDVILAPSITVSPRLWTELYPAEIDGRAMGSYYQWLALAYAATLVGHPAISLPVGVDSLGMPFGLQIVGRRGGDAAVLAVAAELERMFATMPGLARPVPDLAALEKAPPISGMAGFMGMD
jgi:Asp-tRNA(Asn)/Glu-tRNA(Gln) amidotransferase A subunit family amidase